MTQAIDGIEYYTGDEVARLLGIKKETLYAYVSRGILKSYRQRIGRHRLYRRDEVDALRGVEGVATEASSGGENAPQRQNTGDLPDAAEWIGDH